MSNVIGFKAFKNTLKRDSGYAPVSGENGYSVIRCVFPVGGDWDNISAATAGFFVHPKNIAYVMAAITDDGEERAALFTIPGALLKQGERLHFGLFATVGGVTIATNTVALDVERGIVSDDIDYDPEEAAGMFEQFSNALNTALLGKANKAAAGSAGELAALDGNGSPIRSGVSVIQSIGEGSNSRVPTTAAVKNALDGKADKAAAGTDGELAALDGNGALKRSGVTVAQSVGEGSADKVPTTEAVKTALDGKADKLVNGDVAFTDRILIASNNGGIKNSGYTINNARLSGDVNLTVPSSNVVAIALEGKADKAAAGTDGELAALDGNGSPIRSGVSVIQSIGEGSNSRVPTTAAVKNALDGKADKATTLAGYGINDAYTKAEVTALNSAKVDKADYTEVVQEIAEEVGDLKSALNGTVDLIGDTTIYNVSLAESGTGVGANWNLYYDKSLPKGTKLNFYLSAYTGVLFTNVLFRFYDTTNTLRNLTPSVMQTGKLQTYTLFEDCTRIWVQINRSAPENGVSAQFIMSFDTSGLSADVAKIQSALPTNTQEVLRSDILKNPGRRFKSDGTDEDAGGDTWVISDYIPVGNGLTVTGYSYSRTRPGIVEYNAAKTVLGAQSTASSGEYVTRTYTPPSAVAFVRIQTITSIGGDTSAISVINSAPKVFRVEKNGSGDFTKLSDAINEAVRYMDSTVYVGRGTWNIIDELGVGTDYIVSSDNRGLVLKNRVKVICASDSKITCNYTGSDSDTITWLSAFNAGPLGFTLENATIESSNCRYAIHDERDQDADEYNNYYINCKIKHDNTNGGYNQCIGGGLGLNGHVIIDGCIFENPARTNYKIVSYHNSAGSGKSFVEVKGSYFKGTNTLGFLWYGSSPATQKSTLFAHGNSLGSAIQHTGVSGATVENTEVISFNNEIRPLQV